ncbi:hypothetical protein M8J77_009697 [Diaphorina citri]|nr:hypothetical protein M8J77_009697 [Diaphorina citri]
MLRSPTDRSISRTTTPRKLEFGKPSPTVSWFINNRIVEGRLKTEHNLVVNTLEIASVTRENLNDTYKCQAGNTKLILPAEKSLRLELTCK